MSDENQWEIVQRSAGRFHDPVFLDGISKSGVPKEGFGIQYDESSMYHAVKVDPSGSIYPLGVDVSHWQGRMNWDKAKANGVRFAFIKATDGQSFVDDQLERNVAECIRVGIQWGLYHFVRPNISASAQFDHIKRTIDKLDGRDSAYFPLALDFETNMGQSARTASKNLYDLSQFYREAYRSLPIIYTSPGFARTYLLNKPYNWAIYPLWVANWNVTSPLLPDPWKLTGWSAWQFGQRDGATYGAESNLIDMNFLAHQIAPPEGEPPVVMPGSIDVTLSTKVNGVEYVGKATLYRVE